jgi:hypothetical protein
MPGHIGQDVRRCGVGILSREKKARRRSIFADSNQLLACSLELTVTGIFSSDRIRRLSASFGQLVQ